MKNLKNPIQVIKPDYRNSHFTAIEEYFKKQIQLQIGDIENKLSEHQ